MVFLPSDRPRLFPLFLVHHLLVALMLLACRHDSGITLFIWRLTLGKVHKRKDLKDENLLVGLANVCLVNFPTAVSLSFSVGAIKKMTVSHAGGEMEPTCEQRIAAYCW